MRIPPDSVVAYTTRPTSIRLRAAEFLACAQFAVRRRPPSVVEVPPCAAPAHPWRASAVRAGRAVRVLGQHPGGPRGGPGGADGRPGHGRLLPADDRGPRGR